MSIQIVAVLLQIKSSNSFQFLSAFLGFDSTVVVGLCWLSNVDDVTSVFFFSTIGSFVRSRHV